MRKQHSLISESRFGAGSPPRFLILGLAVLWAGFQTSSALCTDGVRGVQTQPRHAWISEGFDPRQSVGIFVGVRVFPKDEQLAEVPFAIDDAIDLAHLFSFELGLIAPEQVYLLLSGEPQKGESRERLLQLVNAGAHRGPASRSDLYLAIDRYPLQAPAGPDGLLVISLATHGYSHDGDHYMMAEDSLGRRVEETGFLGQRLLETSTQEGTPRRRIILLDTCRQRIFKIRTNRPDPRVRMPRALSDALALAQGEVVVSASRLGGVAFDDNTRGNGVFTGAVLDGLRCAAPTDPRGFVTVENLVNYVDGAVSEWVELRQGNNPGWPLGIQSTLAGPARKLPLVMCRGENPVMEIGWSSYQLMIALMRSGPKVFEVQIRTPEFDLIVRPNKAERHTVPMTGKPGNLLAGTWRLYVEDLEVSAPIYSKDKQQGLVIWRLSIAGDFWFGSHHSLLL